MQPQSSPTRLIPLTQGLWTLVDAADYDALSPFKWIAARESRMGNAYYAIRNVGGRFDGQFRMHRVILGLPRGRVPEVDHINGDGLDNRRCNLRLATRAEQQHNHGIPASNTSGYKGVSFFRKTKRWRAGIKVHYRSYHLGFFDSPVEAALAYDAAARRMFGEFARLNFP